MFLIYGKRKARIKKLTLHDRSCAGCRNFDFEIKIYRKYFHLFFVPCFPIGDNTMEIRCRNCGEPLRSDSLQKHIASGLKTPFYLYSIPVLFGVLVVLIVIVNQFTQKEKAQFVSNPKVNDVYQIRSDYNGKTLYSFLRLVRISGDTVFFYPNRFEYSGFTTKFSNSDYFVKDDKMFYTKQHLKQMLQNGEINGVERKYGDAEGFNRIQ